MQSSLNRADSVSSFSQVKMEDAPRLLRIPKSEWPDFLISVPQHKWPKSWSNVKDPVVPFERNLYGHPLAGLLWDRRFEEVPMDLGWKKLPNWECLFVHRKQGLFLSKHEDNIKMAGENQNMAPMWKKLMKNVDLDPPTSFLYHV